LSGHSSFYVRQHIYYRITEELLKTIFNFKTIHTKLTGQLLHRSHFKVMLIEVVLNVVSKSISALLSLVLYHQIHARPVKVASW